MSEQPPKSPLRRAERAPLRAAVSFRMPSGRVAYGWAADVSLKGIYVRTDERERIGAVCELRLTIRRPDGPVRLELDGQVARHDAGGIAFQFTAMSRETEATLWEIVESHLKDEFAPAPGGTPPRPARPRTDR